jgi:integrase
MATIRKRSNKKGGNSWQIDYYTPEGKRKMKCFSKKADAEAYLGKVLAAKKEGRYHDVFDVKLETHTTFNELADRYVENYQHQRSFSSLKGYLIRGFREVFGDKQLGQITFLDLETYRNRSKATPTRWGKVKADTTVNREMVVLGHILNKAVEWGMLEASPSQKGQRLMFKENNQRLRFLSNDEIDKLLAACSLHLRPVVEVALHTGMRRGELLSLKWEQIHHGQIYLTKTKTDKARQIPINNRLADLLRELRQKNHLKSPYVFCFPNGDRVRHIKNGFLGACRRAGLEDFHFHDLRHTFASHLVMNGVGLKAVQELLGHADIKTTMRYAHLSQEHLREAVSVLNKLGNGKQTVNISPKGHEADKCQIANSL